MIPTQSLKKLDRSLKIIIIFILVCGFLLQLKKISSKHMPEHTEVYLHRGQEKSKDLESTFKLVEKNPGVELS